MNWYRDIQDSWDWLLSKLSAIGHLLKSFFSNKKPHREDNNMLTRELSPRQLVLKLIWESDGPIDLLKIMNEHSIARDKDLLADLKAQSLNTSSNLEEYLLDIRDGLKEIHELVAQYASVKNFKELVEWKRRSPLCFSQGMSDLINLTINDWLSQNQLAQAAALEVAVQVEEELNQIWDKFNELFKIPGDSLNQFLKDNPRLYDPLFHELLGIRSEIDDESSMALRKMREQLVHVCRFRASIAEIEKIQADKTRAANSDPNSTIKIVTPLTSEQSEFWFLINEHQNSIVEPLVEKVNTGEITIEDGEQQLLLNEKQLPPQTELYVKSYYYARLIFHGPPVIFNSVLSRYRDLILSDLCKKLDEDDIRIRPTALLQYGMLIVSHQGKLSSRGEVLADIIRLFDATLEPVFIDKSGPRLLRDLYFTRARCHELLHQYTEAQNDYLAGLQIKGAQHELEPRSRALSDLANTLQRQPNMNRQRHQRILSLFSDALDNLSADESTFMRIQLLVNYSIFLNECPFGNSAENQEQALSLIQRAQSDIGKLDIDFADIYEHIRTQRLDLASRVDLTYGNILRSRHYGPTDNTVKPALNDCVAQQLSNDDRAIEKYNSGIKRIAENKARLNETLGLLRLNLGMAYIDKFEQEESTGLLGQAWYAFNEAIQLLDQSSLFNPRAYLARGMIILYDEDSRDKDSFQQSISDLEQALRSFSDIGIQKELARTHSILGNVYSLRYSSLKVHTDLQSARSAWKTAYEIYKNENDGFPAINLAWRISGSHVEAFIVNKSTEDLHMAIQFLQEAGRLLDELWERFDSIEWHQELSSWFSKVYADLLWCQSKAGKSAEELWIYSSLAKCRELFQHVLGSPYLDQRLSSERADYLSTLRMKMHIAERTRWEVQWSADSLTSVISDIEQWRKEHDESQFARQLVGIPRTLLTSLGINERLRQFQAAYTDSIILDFTLCRWGSTVLIRSKDGTDRLICLPATLQTVSQWIYADNHKDGWLDVYNEYRNAPSRKDDIHFAICSQRWSVATGQLLKRIASEILKPTLDALTAELTDARLVICPGAFSGLPFHAASIGDINTVPLFRLVHGFSYVSTIAALPTTVKDYRKPTSVLCILSDPAEKIADQIKGAPTEVVRVANHFVSVGSQVTVITSTGVRVGHDGLFGATIKLDDRVSVIAERPTPQWLGMHLKNYDHIFYSGHGLGHALIVADQHGNSCEFTQVDLLCSPTLRLRPLVFLSACEIAYEPRALATEAFNFSACLLRAGAGFVIASIWLAIDSWASTFSDNFHRFLALNGDPAVAFCLALAQIESSGKADPICWATFTPFLGI